MTQDINAYKKCDFETEVTALTERLGSRAEDIVFMNIGFTKDDPPQPVVKQSIRGKNITDAHIARAARKIELRYGATDDCSAAYRLDDNDDRPYVVFITDNGFNLTLLGKKLEPISKLYTLYHETGHALMPQGDAVDDLHPYKECVADAYAALRLLQRFGQEAAPYLSMVSWLHAVWGIMGLTDHLTTMTLDNIVADSATRDFSELTHDETMALAQQYAKQGTPTPEALEEAYEFFMQDDESVKITELLASTCIDPESHPIAFLVGAKVAQPLLEPQGIFGDGKALKFTEQDRRIYAERIKARLDSLDLDGLFNENAAKPATAERVAETLKVMLPPGQKRLNFSLGC